MIGSVYDCLPSAALASHLSPPSSHLFPGSVAPSTPPPELSCSECGTGGAGGRSLSTTPSSTLVGHARATAGSPHAPHLPVSRSAPTMSATMDADLLPHVPHSVPSRRGSATSDEASCADSASACVTSTAVTSVTRTERRRSSCPHAHAAHAVTVTISPPTLAVRSASAWLVSSLRCRISNASLFRYREEGRAARVSAIVVVMALGCWAPYVAVLVLHAALPRHAAATPRHLDALALAALAAAVCISPCLFAFRNRRVQKEVGLLSSPLSSPPPVLQPTATAPLTDVCAFSGPANALPVGPRPEGLSGPRPRLRHGVREGQRPEGQWRPRRPRRRRQRASTAPPQPHGQPGRGLQHAVRQVSLGDERERGSLPLPLRPSLSLMLIHCFASSLQHLGAHSVELEHRQGFEPRAEGPQLARRRRRQRRERTHGLRVAAAHHPRPALGTAPSARGRPDRGDGQELLLVGGVLLPGVRSLDGHRGRVN